MGRTRTKLAGLSFVLAMLAFFVVPLPAFAAKQTPTFQFKSGSYSVSENQSPAAIAITRNPKGGGSVHFRTAGGSATGGSDCTDVANDYVVVTDQLVSFANQREKTTPVTICNNNNEFEGNETVVLQLFDPSNGVSLGAKKEVTLTIVDDDPQPGLSINDRTGPEGSSRVFTVTTDAASTLPIQFDWDTADGTAKVADGDYAAQGATEVIPAGPAGSTATFGVASLDDSIDEPVEFFNVVLSNVIGASVTDGTGTFTLNDDDAAPTLSISGASGDPSATEGSPMDYVVSLSGPTGAPITFEFYTDENASPAANGENNCGIAGADFDHVELPNTVPGSFSVGGPTSVTISRPTCDDADAEGDESFRGIIQNATYDGAAYPGGITDNDATGTILDNDTVTLSVSDASANEDAGTLDFTVTLSAPAASTVTADFDFVDGTALGASDCVSFVSDDYIDPTGLPDGSVTFTAGDTSETLSVGLCADTDVELDETLTVDVIGITGPAVALDGAGAGTIVNDDNSTMTFGSSGAGSYTSYSEAGGQLDGSFAIGGCASCLAQLTAAGSPATFTAPGATSFDLIQYDIIGFPVAGTATWTATPGAATDGGNSTAGTKVMPAGFTGLTSADLSTTGTVRFDNIVFRIH